MTWQARCAGPYPAAQTDACTWNTFYDRQFAAIPAVTAAAEAEAEIPAVPFTPGVAAGLRTTKTFTFTSRGFDTTSGRGVIENKHSTDVEYPPPPCVCMSVHPEGKSCST